MAEPTNRATDQRKEILVPLFNHMSAGECFYVVGGPSVGKTRLLDLMMRDEIQSYYLGDQAGKIRLVRVDMNRLSVQDQVWAFYELLLNSLVLDLSGDQKLVPWVEEFREKDFEIIRQPDLLLAHRYFELAVNILCQEHQLKLCFLFDEFDRTYHSLSKETFSQLRAVRDANKYLVFYGLFLRDLPERLRDSQDQKYYDPDNEDFYELIFRNMLGLGPYTKDDSLQIIQKLVDRRKINVMPIRQEFLYEASGGHIGLVQAFLSNLVEEPEEFHHLGRPSWLDWVSQQSYTVEECRKIWKGISEDEQKALSKVVKGDQVDIPAPIWKLITAKGLVHNDRDAPYLFSPVFERYVRSL